MPLTLKPRPALPGFTLSPSPPLSDLPTADAQGSGSGSGSAVTTIPRPPADFIPEKDMYMFGTYPLLGAGEVGRGMVRCKRCGKVGLEWAAGEHRRICNHVLDGTPLTTKKITKASKTTEMSKKRRASEASEILLSPKKRAKLPQPSQPSLTESAEPDEIDESVYSNPSYKGMKKNEIKKVEKERMRLERKEAKEKERMEIAERKRLRARVMDDSAAATNPINLDRQCGVINDKNIPCARSLTCKTHTVGAKRAVQGRTRPYDLLYLEWQREHNPNFKEPQKRERDKDTKAKDKHKLPLAVAGKKKKVSKKNPDEGLGDDEDGLRELDELVNLTRLAGERVRGAFLSLGTASQAAGSSSPAPALASAPVPAGGNGQRSSISGPAGTGTGTAAPGSKLPTPTTATNPDTKPNASPNPTVPLNTIPFQSIWRSSTSEFATVGQMLTKALAARSKSAQHAHPHAHAGGKAGTGTGARAPLSLPLGAGQGQGHGQPGSAAGEFGVGVVA